MARRGARDSDKQIKRHTCGSVLMADTSVKTIELPIKANFRKVWCLEYFISAHGARKVFPITALSYRVPVIWPVVWIDVSQINYTWGRLLWRCWGILDSGYVDSLFADV